MNENLVGKTFFCDGEEYIVEEILLFGHRCIARNLNYDTTEQFYCDSVAEWVKREKEKIEKGLNLQKQYENKINYNEKTKEELLSIISDLETTIDDKDKKERKYHETPQSLIKEIEMSKVEHIKNDIKLEKKYNETNKMVQNICNAIKHAIDETSSC